jgi:hypothetical protein
MPRAVTARGGGHTDFAATGVGSFLVLRRRVSSVRDAKRSVTQAIQRAVCSLHLGEASPREFVVADEDLLPELVRDTPSPFSDLLETRACILGHPAAVRETKHI